MQHGTRFSSLNNVFKMRDTAPPPPPPPKDSLIPCDRSLFARSAVSLSLSPSLSPESASGPVTPSTPYPKTFSPPSIDGTDSSGSCPHPGDMYLLNGASASAYTVGQATPSRSKTKKAVLKLASLARRNKSKKDLSLSDSASTSGSLSRGASMSEHDDVEGDAGISPPWNFQHNIHVDEGYIGLPPSWTSALSQAGFDDDEIAAIHARRRAAVTGTGAATPHTPSTPASTLLQPLPRSTSLGLPSAATVGPLPSSGRSSPAPSSFSVRSFVCGIKQSLSDAGADSGTPGEESELYVIVDGDGPREYRADQTLIEPYPLDASSASSSSQAQQTPRTPAFPHIQVQRALSDASHGSSAPRAPSPLAHSNSLPIPSPPRGSSSLASASLRSGSVSAPPRTPPKRVYHIANPSSNSNEGIAYPEPPPAYVSPKKEQLARKKDKDGLASPPSRPVPPAPASGEPCRTNNRDSDQEASMTETGGASIPATADEVLDISSYYTDSPMDPENVSSPTPPLVIDKRMTKLTAMPPRISLHQDSLEDWSESLFSAIGKAKRSSVLVASGESSRPPSSPKTAAPSLPDISFGANLTLGPQPMMGAVQEDDEQEEGAPTTAEEQDSPVLPDVSLGPPVGKDFDRPRSVSPPRPSIESLPPSPPPKPKPKPAPIALPPAVALAPPRMNVITGISGRSPVNALFGAKPQPLPIPIPPSQIRAQLRPAPPKPAYPPPTLPLPPLKQTPSQPNLRPPSQLPSPPQRLLKHDSTVSRASPSDSRPSSTQTLLPTRTNQGDRDSGFSTITVTPATIATAKTEVVRTAVASVIDSDAVSLASRRESVLSTADAEPQDESRAETRKVGELPDDSMTSESCSVSLLRDDSQSKWPAPPPPPIELETDSTPCRVSRFRTTSLGRVSQLQAMVSSPMSSHFSHGSSETASSSTSESGSLTTPKEVNGVLPRVKSGLAAEARLLTSASDTFGGVDVESKSDEDDEDEDDESQPLETPVSRSLASLPHPLLVQLQPYISPRDPASIFTNLVEIAEGESGSVFAARIAPSFAEGSQQDTERPVTPGTSHVAIKRIPLPPPSSLPLLSDDSAVSNKLVSVLHEVSLLKNLDHEHLLLLDAIHVGSGSGDVGSANGVDTSLWIRMELMERSLADVIGLVGEGLALQERMVGRFASDILHGLDYLQRRHIAHRDVRSDNLLVNAGGVVKLADFSNAVHVDRNAPMVNGAVGVVYWQAPEMRAGPYNALKVDVWSLGATVWELAETVPPFSMPCSPSMQTSFGVQTPRHVGSQWPPLTHPELYSRAFHEFLRLCGRESAGRPGPGELLNTPFIRNACGRAVILQLLSQCRAIEEALVSNEGPSR